MNNRRNELLLVSAREYCKCVVEGKTIKYNQLIVNGNFTNSNDWTLFNSSLSVSNNVATVTPTGIHSSLSCSASSQNGHKYLVTFEIKLQSDAYFNLGVFGINEYAINGTGNWERITRILTPTDTDNAFFILDYDDTIHQTYYVKNVQIIDLTALGLGNINSVTDFYATDLGKYIAKGNYLPYEPNGKFIHAQSPINFEGVNIWNSVFESGLTLYKGDKYKTYGIDEISYNNLILNANQDYVNSNTDSANANAIVYGANGGIYWAENLTSLGFYSGTFESNTTEFVNIYMSGNNANLYFATNIQMTSGHKYYISFNVLGNNASVVGGLRLVNLRLIDLTQLGLSALTDKLRIFLQKNYKLPFTLVNKTIKDQIVRTMKEIDLSSLTWTWEGDYWDADISNIDDIKKDYQSDETPNAIAEKYRVVSVNQDTQEGYPVGNLVIEGSEFSGYYIEINSNDSQNAPSGKMLIELLQPTLVMWQTLDIEDYNEFVTTDTPNIYKLNRDLSDYGVLDATSDTGTKQANLTMLNIAGARGDFCYQDGYIYQKTNDIENAWIYQIQISNAPSRMVSRRTINVESENGIDLDFTKE